MSAKKSTQPDSPRRMRYTDSLVLYQSNKLVRSRQIPVTLTQMKISRAAIAQILSSDDNFFTLTTPIKELSEAMHITIPTLYRELPSLTEIRSGPTESLPGVDFRTLVWFTYVQVQGGILEIDMNPRLKPFLIGLKKNFSAYSLSAIANLNSVYAIRLFEILNSYQNMMLKNIELEDDGIKVEGNTLTYELPKLKAVLNCEDLYPENISMFVRRILQPCVEDIQKNTGMLVDFSLIRTSRKVSHVVFTVANAAYTPLTAVPNTPLSR